MPLYDNAWLRAREQRTRGARPDYTVDIPKESVVSEAPVGDDPVQAAKAFLASTTPRVNPNAPLSPEDQAEVNARMDWAGKNLDEAERIAQARKGTFRHITEALNTAGNVAGLASLPLLAAGPQASGAAMALGGLLTVPDQLRRAYAPQADETEPGVGEAAMTGLALLPGLSMGKKATTAAEDIYGLGKYGRVGPSQYENIDAVTGLPYKGSTNFQVVEPRPLNIRRPSVAALESPYGRKIPLSMADKARGRAFGLPDNGENAWTAFEQLANRSEGVKHAGTSLDDLLYKGPEIDLTPLVRASEQAKRQRAIAAAFRSGMPLAEGF